MNKKEVCVWKNSDFWIKKRRVKKISERKKEKKWSLKKKGENFGEGYWLKRKKK